MYIITLLVIAGAGCDAFLDSMYRQVHANCSEFDMYSCRNTRCIPRSQVCNGKDDCLDNSDEDDCEAWTCTSKDLFKCKNNLCISKAFLCDGDDDCGDFSDELSCNESNVPEECSEDEWACEDKRCISSEFVCNGKKDCADGSDESVGCSKPMDCTGFLCKNGHCILNHWRCDGVEDCADGTDEQNCEISPEHCSLDERRFLCANNVTCIDLSKLCDGNPDCPDKSDESILCTDKTRTCANHNCSHQCQMTPQGPKCLCPIGYHNVDEKTCIDIDECAILGSCGQKCKNTQGSYVCSCDYGYSLQKDNSSCKLRSGSAVMYISTKTEIRSFFLESKRYDTIASGLKQTVGISSDGYHIYWSEIFSEHENIYKADDDGSNKELIVTSGLGAPEDLAIDWITGNIYFTDSENIHIGVCTHDGAICTVIINKDIRKPRGIVLSPADGLMFWSDWGNPAEIARANMDGSEDTAFVSENIYWPNGLALDLPNERLYWVDAKKKTIESIGIDGHGRRIVLDDVIRHPYAIAVFEDKIFWSDWKSHSVQSCNKFTGKDHEVLVKEKKQDIYGIHIQHSAMRTTSYNPCGSSFCQEMCLLSGKTYKCACPPHMKLNPDNHTCAYTEKPQNLVVGTKDVLLRVFHQSLGRHEVETLEGSVKNLGAMAYNDLKNSLYLYDLSEKDIIELPLDKSKEPKRMKLDLPSTISDLDFDNLGNNLYWLVSEKNTIEVYSITSKTQKVLVHDLGDERPISLALVPQEGVMFVAFESKSHFGVHIDIFTMDGRSRTHAIETGLIGPISLAYDYNLDRVFFADAGSGVIESSSIHGDDRNEHKILRSHPVSLASLKDDLFWTNLKSKRLYWTNKYQPSSSSKHIKLDLPIDSEVVHITSVTQLPRPDHACHENNGNCSHFCLLSGHSFSCSCPLGLELKADMRTCYKPKRCSNEQFTCEVSDMCIPYSLRCDKKKDCPQGEDEANCREEKACGFFEFKCGDGTCIDEDKVCDQHYDCGDKSDEEGAGCSQAVALGKCGPNYHRCSDGHCLSTSLVCDGIQDCPDSSDEKDCQDLTCNSNQFKCRSGSCIPKHFECDHEYDCQDLSDEHADCEPLTCSPKQFTCKNGRCLDKKFFCDQADDCGDNSDEADCTKSDNCGIHEMACDSNQTICIPFSARCDGMADCPQGEDENNCNNCHEGDFECTNKKCIPSHWLCDKTDDCGDNSDESTQVCSGNNTKVLYNIVPPCDDGFRCKYGKCLDWKLVCNGHEDCIDGSDEHGSCESACQKDNPCQQKCHPSPSGPACLCNEGYELAGDGKTCKDKQECSRDPPVCSQLCRESPGSFKCNCYENFILRSDRVSCKSLGEPMKMFFSSGGDIRSLSQADKGLEEVKTNPSSITGMSSSIRKGYLYYSMEMAGTIHRIHLDNGTEEHITTPGQPKVISLDWSTENLYYYDADSQDKSIKVCNMDSQSCSSIIELNTHEHISALAVDGQNKVIFYSVVHFFVFNSPTSIIYKTKLDGSNKEEFVKSFKGFITGIEFDQNKKYVYYIDDIQNQLVSLKYDGSDRKVLIGNLTKSVSGLSLFEDKLYYGMRSGYLGICKLYGETRDCSAFKLNPYTLTSFVIYQESRQNQLTNPCLNSKCTNICIPADVGVKCLCENGEPAKEGDSCPNDSRMATSEERRHKFNLHKGVNVKESSKESASSSIVAGILVPVFILLLVGGVYFYMKRRNTGGLNISMRFTNPAYGLARGADHPVGIQPGEHEYCNPINFPNAEMQTTTNNILQKLTPLVKIDDS